MGQAFSQKSRMDTSLSRSGMMHCLMKRYQTNHDEEPMAEHLKDELRKNTQENMWNTKFAKPSILGKPVGQPLKNQSVVRQPTAFKSERPRISKPRFASQVDVNNDLSKPVTTHHLPKGRESAPAKPHHMIAPSSSRVLFKYRYIVQSYKGRTQSLVAKKKDISENRASRNFDLMITQMTFEHNISSLGRQCQMASAENNTSGPVPQFKFKAGSKSCSLSKQDSYITTRVGITIPPSHSNAEDNSHKVVRLGINPMIQPEPEDLPKDNPKLEIAVLSFEGVEELKRNVWIKGLKKEALHTLRQKPGQYIIYQITKMIVGWQSAQLSIVLKPNALSSLEDRDQSYLVRTTFPFQTLVEHHKFTSAIKSQTVVELGNLNPIQMHKSSKTFYLGKLKDLKTKTSANADLKLQDIAKVVRLGINPMIQPEPEDLPKDNPKLEIAVLRRGRDKEMYGLKGSKERSPPHNLRQ
ncbi:hypothetical protein Tco_0794465 [Tanacetum coccineum]